MVVIVLGQWLYDENVLAATMVVVIMAIVVVVVM